MTEARLEYLPLSEVMPAARNAKEHDIGAIYSSMRRWGFTSPVILDERTGRMVAGHGRVEALRQMQSNGERPPDRILPGKDGEWLVPVIFGVEFANDTEAEAYGIADNQLTILGGWDDSTLADMLQELASIERLEGTGFDGDDVSRLLADLNEPLKSDAGEHHCCRDD